MERHRQGKGGIVSRLWGGPSWQHGNQYCDEVSISLSSYLKISIGIYSNIDGGKGLALHLQDLLHVVGDGIA